jgi:hypothetical protein
LQDVRSIGPTFRRWDETLKSPAFISMLESITGIVDLLFEPQ